MEMTKPHANVRYRWVWLIIALFILSHTLHLIYFVSFLSSHFPNSPQLECKSHEGWHLDPSLKTGSPELRKRPGTEWAPFDKYLWNEWMNEWIIKCLLLSVYTKIPGKISVPFSVFLLSFPSIILYGMSWLSTQENKFVTSQAWHVCSFTQPGLSTWDLLFSAFGYSFIQPTLIACLQWARHPIKWWRNNGDPN